MFTGIIEGLGTISAVQSVGAGRRLTVTTDFSLSGTKIGDSIAVNGACLTAVAAEDRRFQADVSPETWTVTAFAAARIGDRVNIERALRLSDRLDGHLVSGHVDGVGKIASRRKTGNAIIYGFRAPDELLRSMIRKGSVAVDGVSLTVNAVTRDGFEVSVIPHTAERTAFGARKIGDPVNIETDMIGKYVEKFLAGAAGKQEDSRPDRGGIDMGFLEKTGFL